MLNTQGLEKLLKVGRIILLLYTHWGSHEKTVQQTGFVFHLLSLKTTRDFNRTPCTLVSG